MKDTHTIHVNKVKWIYQDFLQSAQGTFMESSWTGWCKCTYLSLKLSHKNLGCSLVHYHNLEVCQAVHQSRETRFSEEKPLSKRNGLCARELMKVYTRASCKHQVSTKNNNACADTEAVQNPQCFTSCKNCNVKCPFCQLFLAGLCINYNEWLRTLATNFPS